MAGAKLEPTRWPGIYRRGGRYAYEWTDAAGKRRRATADDREAASSRKAEEEAKAARGELPDSGGRTRATVASYALEIFGADPHRDANEKPARGRYAGRHGAIRSKTVDEYRRDLERYALPAIGRKRIGNVRTPDLSRLAADLAARDGSDYLADRTIRRVFAPISALFATAVDEGLVAHNPVRDVRMPSGRDALRRFDADDQDDADEPAPGKARALTREQLGEFLAIVDPRWRPFFELLASTGLRVSEALALRWGDLRLDGSEPVVRVRRAYVKGSYGPPKSRHGRRDVPLPFGVVSALRARRAASEWPDDAGLVFPSGKGTPMSAENLARRTLKPAMQEAGASWAGFHAFRHFTASQLIADGRNVVQVSRWLGHHSPGFTLAVYAHLMDDGVGRPLDLEGVGSGSCSRPRDSSGGLDVEPRIPRFAGGSSATPNPA